MIHKLPENVHELLYQCELVESAPSETINLDAVAPFLQERARADRTGTILGLAKYIQNEEAANEAKKAHIKAKQAEITSSERRINFFKAQCAIMMQTGEKLKDEAVSVSTRTSTKVNLLVDEAELPDNFATIKTTKSANKTLIKELLDAGDEEAKKVAVLQTNINLAIK